MKLPAFFGHKRSINLLPRDPFESSTLGVILEWCLVFGKWTVILTQLVVMGAFLYRFTLDRQLTDLRKSIAQSVAVIKSYEQIEKEFILTQKQVQTVEDSIAVQKLLISVIDNVERNTPIEVWYDRMTFSPESISLTAYAASLPAFGQYLTAIQANPLFKTVRIGKIESSTSKGAQLQFDVSMNLANEKPKGSSR